MKPVLQLTFWLLFAFGCAKIPAGSVTLADALQKEGERMHTLNLSLVNRMFSDKREAIDRFINGEYTLTVADNFIKKVQTTDFKKDFPEMVQALLPEINARRDSLVKVLELQREKITDKLNTDFNAFNTAAVSLKLMLQSAVKLNKEQQALFDQVKTLSNTRIDLVSIEGALDRFVNSAGNVGGKIVDIDSSINNILKK